VHLPSEYPNRSGFDPGAPARVDGFAGHKIHFGSKNFLHSLLQRQQIEQSKPL